LKNSKQENNKKYKENTENNSDKIESNKGNTEDNNIHMERQQDNTENIHDNVKNKDNMEDIHDNEKDKDNTENIHDNLKNKDNTENLGSLYDLHFKSSSYLDMFKSVHDMPGIRWTLTERARLFSGRGTLCQGAVQGVARSVIEVGTGPTPFNTGPLAAWATNIVWSDFTLANREYLWRWLGEKGSTPPFQSFFDFAASFDGESGDVQADRLRGKVAGVFYVDLHQHNPLHPLCVQADVVFSHLVLEYVAPSRVLQEPLQEHN